MSEAASPAQGASTPVRSTVALGPPSGTEPEVGRSRHVHRRAAAPWSGYRDLVALPVVFVIGSLVTWARAPSILLHPTLWAEDGTVFFSAAYNLGWHASLTQTYAGYLQTSSRLFADAGLLVPLVRVPLYFVVIALAIQVLPAVLLASRRFARVVPDARVRLLLAALYLVIPNSSEINVNLVDNQWHLAVLAVLIVLATPATGLWKVFDVVFMVLSCLTGPFVLSLLVIVVIVFLRARQRWTLVLGAIALVGGGIQFYELLTASRGVHAPLGMSVTRLVEIIGGRLVGNTVLGTATSTTTGFTHHLFAYSLLVFAVAGLIVGWAAWKGPFELRMFNLWAGLALAGSLASPLVSLHGSQWQALIGDAGSRYWFFPSLAFVGDVVWLAGRRGRAARWAAAAAVLLLVGMASTGIREDFRYPVVAAPDWGAEVQHFDRLAPGSSYTFRFRPPGWSMTLTKK